MKKFILIMLTVLSMATSVFAVELHGMWDTIYRRTLASEPGRYEQLKEICRKEVGVDANRFKFSGCISSHFTIKENSRQNQEIGLYDVGGVEAFDKRLAESSDEPAPAKLKELVIGMILTFMIGILWWREVFKIFLKKLKER